MCGRFVIKSAYDALRDALGPADLGGGLPGLPLFNVAPAQTVPIVRRTGDDGGRRELAGVRWGLVPAWSRGFRGPPVVNARGETAARLSTFRDALRVRRCLVPADGFYAWKAGGGGGGATKASRVPHYVRREDGRPFAMAGVWERWRDDDDGGHALDSCAILTTAANAVVAPIHDRMPVILGPADYAIWLDPRTPAADVAALLTPAPAEPMEAYPVSTLVNSPQNQGAELIAPAG